MKATAAAISAAVTTMAADLAGIDAFGTTWALAGLALVGSIAAIPEIENRSKSKVLSAVVTGTAFGAFGGPVLADFLSTKFGVTHIAVTPLAVFLIAHLSYDMVRPVSRWFVRSLDRRGRK